ncbi:MAG: DUF2244 domain-containing protein [Steroidobacteraceae bacterium]
MSAFAVRIDLAPHCSLTPSGARSLFLGTCGVSFGIAGLLTLRGYWPVLAYAGLEMALLGWALHASMQRRHRLETIVVSEDSVVIETCWRGAATRAVFPRHWARVRLRGDFSRLRPARLEIESGGKRCEIGSFLTGEERQRLALRLASLVGGMAESPPLPSGKPRG